MSRTFLPLNDHVDDPAVLCLPHAGGSAASFRELASSMSCSVVGVELPGRGARFREDPIPDATAITAALSAEIVAERGDRPYVLLGHSLGALLAFEIARKLREGSGPAALVVSGVPSPELYSEPARGELGRHELVAEMRRLGGTPEEVLASDELIDLLLPVVRADLAAAAGYRYVPGAPLDLPILALTGAQDPEVGPDDVSGWEAHTTGGFTLSVLKGNHFFLFEPAGDAGALLNAFVQQLPRRAA